MVSKIPLKKKIALQLFRIYKRNTSRLHLLDYLLWESTLRCNLACLHCGSDCKKDSSVKDMPAASFLKAIDDITPVVEPNKTSIVITGGEPLLRKDIEAIGLELYKRGFPWGIVTNGYLLDKKRIGSLTASGLRSITVSLDGFSASHNWLRGKKESFNRAVEAIKILALKKDINFDVVSAINKKNYPELAEFKDFLISIGVKKWRIFTIFPIGRATLHEELKLDSKSFKALFDFIKEVRKKGEIGLSYGCEGFLGNYEAEIRDNFFFCRSGISTATILVDGSITGCPNLRDNFIQGNIYSENFLDVWQNKFQLMRDRSWAKTGICHDCMLFGYCEGNGLHLRNETGKGPFFCHLKKIEDAEKM